MRIGRSKLMGVAQSMLFVALVTAIPAGAEPSGDPPPSPYPQIAHILSTYDEVEPDTLLVDNAPGIWFLTPSGLSCGIWNRGNFGCVGDIPGVPPGTTHIGWFSGDQLVHYDIFAALKFPAGQADLPLRPRSFVRYWGTMCAVNPDGSTYCARGPYHFLVTPTQTWLNG